MGVEHAALACETHAPKLIQLNVFPALHVVAPDAAFAPIRAPASLDPVSAVSSSALTLSDTRQSTTVSSPEAGACVTVAETLAATLLAGASSAVRGASFAPRGCRPPSQLQGAT